MKPRDEILLWLVDSEGRSLALSNVVLDAAFFTRGNLRYSFRLGPTDHEGRLRITYEDIEAKRLDSAQESLMDYNTPLGECDSRIRITLPSTDTLKKAYEIATRWAGRGITPEYAKVWLESNNGCIKLEPVLADLHEGENVMRLVCSQSPQ